MNSLQYRLVNYIAFVFFFTLSSCDSPAQDSVYTFPKTAKEPIAEEFEGITITDNYRYLERTKVDSVDQWYKKQSSYADSVLSSCSLTDTIYSDISAAKSKIKNNVHYLTKDDYGNQYYLKDLEEGSKLFVRPSESNNEIFLFDPKSYKPEEKTAYWIDYLRPSWNGKFVALSLRNNNALTSEVAVLEVASKSLTNDRVTNTRPPNFGGINWLPDCSGFTYLRFPVVNKGEEGYMTGSETRLHELNTGIELGRVLFGSNNGVEFSPSFLPIVKIGSSKSKFIVSHIIDNTHYYDTYFLPIDSAKSKNPNWRPLYSGDDFIYSSLGRLADNQYYFLSAKNAPNFKLSSVDLRTPNIGNATVIVPESESEVISEMAITNTGLYYTTSTNGVIANLYHVENGVSKKVELPFTTGSIEFLHGNQNNDVLLIESYGWANKPSKFSIKNGKILEEISLTNNSAKIGDADSILAEEIMVKGHDGEEIPVSIIYNTAKGRNNVPAIIRSYGASGHNVDPYYNPALLSWVRRGGIIAVAHIRGGGEKGKSWHDAGKKHTKPNSWKDLISVTENLIEKGYTNSERTVLYSSSAGTISQGMAINVRPDLFRVFIGRIPLLNPTRLKEGSHAQISYMEFGDIDKPEEVKALIGLDPYYNLDDNKQYPATLFIAGGNDDRLDLWETGKFIAQLQNSKSPKRPYILKVIPEMGHTAPDSQQYSEMMAFALENID